MIKPLVEISMISYQATPPNRVSRDEHTSRILEKLLPYMLSVVAVILLLTAFLAASYKKYVLGYIWSRPTDISAELPVQSVSGIWTVALEIDETGAWQITNELARRPLGQAGFGGPTASEWFSPQESLVRNLALKSRLPGCTDEIPMPQNSRSKYSQIITAFAKDHGISPSGGYCISAIDAKGENFIMFSFMCVGNRPGNFPYFEIISNCRSGSEKSIERFNLFNIDRDFTQNVDRDSSLAILSLILLESLVILIVVFLLCKRRKKRNKGEGVQRGHSSIARNGWHT